MENKHQKSYYLILDENKYLNQIEKIKYSAQ